MTQGESLCRGTCKVFNLCMVVEHATIRNKLLHLGYRHDRHPCL